MNFLIQTFNIILYQPLFNALIFLYEVLPGNDFGIAIIVFTILVRVVLFLQSSKAQRSLSLLQNGVQEIQKKHKKDKERQMQEIMNLYRQVNIHPVSVFFPILLQLPILIALYRVFWKGLEPASLDYLYSFVSKPATINPYFLNFLDLSQPSPTLAILAGAVQFLQLKKMNAQVKKSQEKKESADEVREMLSRTFFYFLPILTFSILLKVPSAIGLYWIVTILFSMGQQHFSGLGPKTKTSPTPK